MMVVVGLSDPNNVDHSLGAMDRNDEYRTILLRSLLLFWPFKVSNTSIVLVVDEEMMNDEVVGPIIKTNMIERLDGYRQVV